MVTIYAIKCLIDGKEYIGATSMNLRKRLSSHISASNTRSSHLYNAINKFSAKNFEIIKLEDCAPEIALEREQFHVVQKNTLWPNGLNTVLPYGGQFDPSAKLNKSFAQNERFKIKAERKRHSVRMKTMFMNPEYKEKHRQGLINSWTPERREEYRQKALKNKAFYESRNDEAIRRALAKKVHVYNIETKKIKTFATMTEAARDIGSASSAITQSIKRKSVLFNKFIIKKASDPISFEELFHQIEQKKIQEFMNDSAIRTGRAAWNKKQIRLTNVKTGEAKLFESLKSAATYLKRQTTNISYACAKEGRIVADHYAEYV